MIGAETSENKSRGFACIMELSADCILLMLPSTPIPACSSQTFIHSPCQAPIPSTLPKCPVSTHPKVLIPPAYS